MKVQNKNASAEKTKRKIWKAFLEMHSEGIPGDEMTIKDLAKRAEISRSTFYTHYSDLYDLGDQMGAELMEMVLQDREIHNKQDAKELYLHLLDVLQMYEKEIGMLLRSDYPSAFFQQFQAQLKQRMRGAEPEDDTWDLRVSVLIDGTIQQITGYLRHENVRNLSGLCEGLTEICAKLL